MGAVETTAVPFADGTNISAYLYLIEDPGRDLAIRDVAGRTTEWKPNVTGYVNLGYTRSAYWFRVDIDNPRRSERTALLEMISRVSTLSISTFPTLAGDSAKRGRVTVASSNRGRLETRIFFSPDAGARHFNGVHEGPERRLPPFYRAIVYRAGIRREKNRLLPRLWLLYGMLFLVVGFICSCTSSSGSPCICISRSSHRRSFFYQISHRGYAFQFLLARTALVGQRRASLADEPARPVRSALRACVMETRTAALADGQDIFTLRVRTVSDGGRPCVRAAGAPVPADDIRAVDGVRHLVIIHTGNAFRRGNRFARYFLAGMGGVVLFTVVGTLTAFGRLPLNFFTEWSTELGFLWLVFSASAV